ncbi:histone-like nucleoid-structuring protein Lsr2 [Pseudonocardia asaccharolytica]|uniref:Lsr2 family protein n=1 Tax=Pseudonocardia asaccharolytica DSM 44247 = NBRC 16224 TaxID=1123024 RepID=A0A511CY00_9PSEU|nr:Lsr2 family protein [Pseudonocardia asaccharolytica]GEL17337.1 Lsr2 family protein [Pseudonocardia asaccharolytica DSM 44247 = NBRC 16224]
MARNVVVRLVDDLDGSDASETVEFAVDGRTYEIDLSEVNRRKLDEALAPFVAAARNTGRGGSRRRVGASTVVASRQAAGSAAGATAAEVRARNEAIRAWARENGFEVSSRGRIRGEILEAYERRDVTPPAAPQPAAEAPKKKRSRSVKVADPFDVGRAS